MRALHIAAAGPTYKKPTTSSSGHYDGNDDLTQEFSSGRLIRQNEIIRDPSSTLDFKRLLPDRSLFNSGNGFYTHKHAIGNAAWCFYMKKHGYSLEIALKGAMGQGSTVGGEDLLDQRMIKRGYRIK